MKKKYVSLSKLGVFLDNLKNLFALKDHKHAIDTELSETSENPVQNKVINEEFDAIAEGMGALEMLIDGLTDGTTPVSKAEAATTATKATQDASGNVITETYETKSDASAKLTEAKSYTDQMTETAVYFDENDNETVILSGEIDTIADLVGGDA